MLAVFSVRSSDFTVKFQRSDVIFVGPFGVQLVGEEEWGKSWHPLQYNSMGQLSVEEHNSEIFADRLEYDDEIRADHVAGRFGDADIYEIRYVDRGWGKKQVYARVLLEKSKFRNLSTFIDRHLMHSMDIGICVPFGGLRIPEMKLDARFSADPDEDQFKDGIPFLSSGQFTTMASWAHSAARLNKLSHTA